MRERRCKAVSVSGVVLDSFLTMTPRNNVFMGSMCLGITSDAPDDMHIVALLSHDPMTDVWTFLCESEAFDPVPEGQPAPDFTPIFQTHYAEAVAV